MVRNGIKGSKDLTKLLKLTRVVEYKSSIAENFEANLLLQRRQSQRWSEENSKHIDSASHEQTPFILTMTWSVLLSPFYR